jgi:hypothetical protein
MIWLDWNWRGFGIGANFEHAPAVRTFPGCTRLEIFIGPVTITGMWDHRKENQCRPNVRR